MTSEDDDDPNVPYDVGYGKPPKELQFKPGKSGNPHGRPKGTLGLRAAIRLELQSEVTITENGERQLVSKGAIIGKQLVNRAAAGDDKGLGRLLAYMCRLGLLELEPQGDSQSLSPEDIEVLNTMLERWHGRLDE